MRNSPILTQFDTQSPTWTKLLAHYTPLLAKHRARIENPGIEERERIALAWQIATIKDLIALGEVKNVAGAGD